MSLFATADRDMIRDPTDCIYSACSWARIYTAVVYAVLITGTVCVENTFRPTRTVRIPEIVGWADAIDGSVLCFTLSVGATRIGIARVRWLNHIRLDCIQNKTKHFL